ncbi:SDR family oxidoreductase [Marinibaculum pumilum]|uniref:SDR family oxidoreductase n=1 Tax=Marinibaculum pumilum TaxID=1766165 RepID=A0ABV7L0B0_9PROT
MDITGKIAVVTGGASGIGRALSQRLMKDGAAQVVAVDMNGAGAEETAALAGCKAMQANVAQEADIKAVIERTEAEVGPIDLFVSNAGIFRPGGPDSSDADWADSWAVNVMSHVYAARALVPLMTARGGGYLVNTASAAGLLNQIGSATYGVTKHAAVGFAEWLSITYGDKGIKVSVLCPQAVRTAMTAAGPGVAGVDGMLEPEQLCDTVMDCVREERFLILPHPQVKEYMQRKTADYDRWLRGMRRLQEKFEGVPGGPKL